VPLKVVDGIHCQDLDGFLLEDSLDRTLLKCLGRSWLHTSLCVIYITVLGSFQVVHGTYGMHSLCLE
jgi:hypothetical protein